MRLYVPDYRDGTYHPGLLEVTKLILSVQGFSLLDATWQTGSQRIPLATSNGS
jgi:hypothetical protein